MTTCARGPSLHNSPRLCHKQEVDQKETRGEREVREGTPLKGHDVMGRAALANMRDKTHGGVSPFEGQDVSRYDSKRLGSGGFTGQR